MADTPAAPKRTFFRRRILLINPRLQLSFYLFFGLLSSFGIALDVLALHLFFQRFDRLVEGMELPQDHLISQFLVEQRTALFQIFAGTTLIVLGVMFLGGLYLSNKVAGPMYRMRKSLEEMEQSGELREIRFREFDYFTEVADAFNRLVKKLRAPG